MNAECRSQIYRRFQLADFLEVGSWGKAGKPAELEERLIDFAADTCRTALDLRANPVGKHITAQLARCSTTPGANYGEARGAESRRDFIHKMQLCLKELRETSIWLRKIVKLELTKRRPVKPILQEYNELIAIFVASINTAKGR